MSKVNNGTLFASVIVKYPTGQDVTCNIKMHVAPMVGDYMVVRVKDIADKPAVNVEGVVKRVVHDTSAWGSWANRCYDHKLTIVLEV